MNTIYELCIFGLVQIPNFTLNKQFWIVGPNLPKKGASGLKQKKRTLPFSNYLHVRIRFGTKLQLTGCVCYILVSLFCMSLESTLQTRKNVFYFTSKAPFILEIILYKLYIVYKVYNTNINFSDSQMSWRLKCRSM